MLIENIKNRFNREKNKSIEKLRLLVQAMEEQQMWKDQELLAAVDQLVRTTGRFDFPYYSLFSSPVSFVDSRSSE
jgi:hypothetical protein